MQSTEQQPSIEDELTDTQYQRRSHDQQTRLTIEEESAAESDEQGERQAASDNEHSSREGEPQTTTSVSEASALTAVERRAQCERRRVSTPNDRQFTEEMDRLLASDSSLYTELHEQDEQHEQQMTRLRREMERIEHEGRTRPWIEAYRRSEHSYGYGDRRVMQYASQLRRYQ